MTNDNIDRADEYLNSRTGHYEQRAVRYRHAANILVKNGLSDDDTLIDLGAGMTEFDFCLRAEFDWRGRYIPVDAGIDGTDLDSPEWVPPRKAEWFVGLEIIEHLYAPYLLVDDLKAYATKGILFSTPNPRTTDVFGMDPTHVSAISKRMMERRGFAVREETLYGGRFSGGEPDSLFGVWLAPNGTRGELL